MCALIYIFLSYSQTNSYQAIVISDGIQTYTVFTYNCGMLQWVGLPGSFSVAGFNVRNDDNFRAVSSSFNIQSSQNFPLSGTRNIQNVACLNARENINWSNLVYKIGGTVDTTVQAQVECRRLAMVDRLTPYLSANVSCPCSLFQARLDRNFNLFDIVSDNGATALCYVPRFPAASTNASQKCCYSVR